MSNEFMGLAEVAAFLAISENQAGRLNLPVYYRRADVLAAIDAERLRILPKKARRATSPGAILSQTWVYFVQHPDTKHIKIGISNDVGRRRRELENLGGCKLVLLVAYEAPTGEEERLHQEFHSHRLIGEWFREAPEILACASIMRLRPGAIRE